MRASVKLAACACFACVGLASPLARANGFFLYEVSARSVAQAGATIAEGEEPATVFFNPAGMTRLPGLQLHGGLTTYVAPNSFEGPTGRKESAKTGVFPLPHVFATYKPLPWLAAGIGGYSAYGLGVEWPDGWSGYSLVKKVQLNSYSIQPSVAFGPFRGVSAGAGFDVLMGSVEISRGLPLASGQWGQMRLGGSTVAYGANFGLFYEPAKWMRFGATFRTGIKVSLDSGKADFTVPAAYDKMLADQPVKTAIHLPAVFGLGGRFQVHKAVQVEADGVIVMWNSYDKLAFTFPQDPTLNQSQDKSWKNAYQLRLGGQYQLNKLALRAGLIFDKNPIPNRTLDPTLPDTDRWDFSAGAGYDFGRFRVDGAYLLDYLVPREAKAPDNPFPGKYHGVVHTGVLNVVVKL